MTSYEHYPRRSSEAYYAHHTQGQPQMTANEYKPRASYEHSGYDGYDSRARRQSNQSPYGPPPRDVNEPNRPDLRRQSLSHQPPPNPQMTPPIMQPSRSYYGGYQETQSPPPAQGPMPIPGAQPFMRDPNNYPSYPPMQPASYPRRASHQQTLHPASAIETPPRTSNDYEDTAIRFDDSAYSHPYDGDHRPRSYSTTSRASRHSGNSRDWDDNRSRRSSHSSSGGTHHKRRRYSEEPRPTIGDSMMLVWKGAKKLLTSERE